MKKPTKILIYLLLLASLQACGWLAPYQREIQQGHILDESAVAQVEPGMTQAQVSFLLGEPLLHSPAAPDEWLYIYQLRRGTELLDRKEVRIRFALDAAGQLRVSEIQRQNI